MKINSGDRRQTGCSRFYRKTELVATEAEMDWNVRGRKRNIRVGLASFLSSCKSLSDLGSDRFRLSEFSCTYKCSQWLLSSVVVNCCKVDLCEWAFSICRGRSGIEYNS